MSSLKEISRSPYAAGAGIGLLNILAFATAGRGLGITSAFEDGVALAEQRVAPDLTQVNAYLQQREETPKMGWETFLVLGVLAGSALAANAADERSHRTIPPAWQRQFGHSAGARLAAAFAGGAMMMFGARMAKGCTSGHAITGNSQLAASSMLFTPIMFASAAAVAHALFGKDIRHERH
jgi:uncharacterized membrane protein YedE/YeeE